MCWTALTLLRAFNGAPGFGGFAKVKRFSVPHQGFEACYSLSFGQRQQLSGKIRSVALPFGWATDEVC
jgi:hypothetical protein